MNQHQRPGDSAVAPMNALVLGGGGPGGASWLAALLDELRSTGIPLTESDVVLGTSAGAVTGAWLTMRPAGLPSISDRMRERAAWHASNAESGGGDPDLLRRIAEGSKAGANSALDIGQAAIAAIPPISADQAKSLWENALPTGQWPRSLRLVSVDANTGTARAWSADDDISLAVAVSCSTAAPGGAPPVEVAGSVWVDGGVRSGTNADLLVEPDMTGYGTGPGRVLVVAPIPTDDLPREEAILVERGHRVRVITPVPFYERLRDLFDPRIIDIAAAAGSSQAREITEDLATWWNE